MSGGLLGLGTVDPTTVGMVAVPSIAKYSMPEYVMVDLGQSSPDSQGNLAALQITWFVVISMAGAVIVLLPCCCCYLKHRRNAALAAGSMGGLQAPFEAGVGTTAATARVSAGPITVFRDSRASELSSSNAVNRLDQQARVHGPSGGL